MIMSSFVWASLYKYCTVSSIQMPMRTWIDFDLISMNDMTFTCYSFLCIILATVLYLYLVPGMQAKNLVVDMGFLFEGNNKAVLPESMMGTVRLTNIDFNADLRTVEDY